MNIGLVIAGGVGRRVGAAIPKQFLMVMGKPIIVYTLENLQQAKSIDRLVVVVPEGWEDFTREHAHRYGITKLESVIEGGATRMESVYNGVKHIASIADGRSGVCLLDANRPMVSSEMIDTCMEKLGESGAVLTVEPLFDSIYYSENGTRLNNSVDRSKLFKGQGPEAVRLDEGIEVFTKGFEDGRDYVLTQLMLNYGRSVTLHKGSLRNFKITTQEDIEFFEAYLMYDREKTL